MKQLLFMFLLGVSCFFARGQEKKSDIESTRPGITKPVEGAKTAMLLDQELCLEVETLKKTLKKDVTIEVVDLVQEKRVLEESGLVVTPPRLSRL